MSPSTAIASRFAAALALVCAPPVVTEISCFTPSIVITIFDAAGARPPTRTRDTFVVKPGNSVRMSYVPGATRSNRKTPAPSVTPVCAASPLAGISATSAPGKTAPV